ncbi:MAG: hypothetical protein R3C19_24485 [Planctomycetaceae bacterium]
MAGHEKKLSNSNFVDKAPADVVNGVRETLAGLKSQLESVEQAISGTATLQPGLREQLVRQSPIRW